jgi:hypothetical protein
VRFQYYTNVVSAAKMWTNNTRAAYAILNGLCDQGWWRAPGGGYRGDGKAFSAPMPMIRVPVMDPTLAAWSRGDCVMNKLLLSEPSVLKG